MNLDALQEDLWITLCQLEMYFPPMFFDIMVHVTIHLVREIKWCGPVFLRSMYPFERYMGILKQFIRNRSRPEGSIVEGYASEEVVEWSIDYMGTVKPIGLPKSRHQGRLAGIGISGKKAIIPDRMLLDQAHSMILQHVKVVSSYINKHMKKLHNDYPEATDVWITKEHNHRFDTWLREQPHDDPTVRNLAAGPSCSVLTWQGMDLNGYTFYTRDQDGKSTNQNSGIRIDAIDASGRKATYYGYIQEIWELNYVTEKMVLFRCRWVNLSQVKVDKYGFVTVDLSSTTTYKEEPFVLADHVRQVFYVADPSNPRRHVVRESKRSIVGIDDVVDEEEYNKFDEEASSLAATTLFEAEAIQDEATYVRNDHDEGLTFDAN